MPNASSFNTLIHGWCKASKLEEAWQTTQEMIEFGFKPCVITYTSLIEAYCFERDFHKVEAVLDEMRTKDRLGENYYVRRPEANPDAPHHPDTGASGWVQVMWRVRIRLRTFRTPDIIIRLVWMAKNSSK
ncbi:Pentatricopeptide repeat-containing protein [Dendrobium catenatum]|uniref:Pentatricopeptide repeat-containing protein n=1 Tax=Dendrobium catenatum TaxID=906689 RepID=A0A2I0VWG3_9ASPA|nr:Pentatricopeptide repeat-containing protein [Dendrobium catenatum]